MFEQGLIFNPDVGLCEEAEREREIISHKELMQPLVAEYDYYLLFYTQCWHGKHRDRPKNI